jgi:hypothetical protein
MNIMINYRKQENEDLIKVINYVSKNENIFFPYSPAHIEEIAVIRRKGGKSSNKYINQNLRVVSKISKNYEYKPSDKGILLVSEKPKICFDRVVEDYPNTTIKAEGWERDKVSSWNTLKIKYTSDELDKMLPEEIFKDNDIVDLLKKKLSPPYIPKYYEFQYNFKTIEVLLEVIFDFLDEIGYKNDKRAIKKEKYRSRMHDISHGIYATKASVIVTDDANFKDKLTAVYSLLAISTKIISSEEFIENYS